MKKLEKAKNKVSNTYNDRSNIRSKNVYRMPKDKEDTRSPKNCNENGDLSSPSHKHAHAGTHTRAHTHTHTYTNILKEWIFGCWIILKQFFEPRSAERMKEKRREEK